MRLPLLLDTNICIWVMNGQLPQRGVEALTEAYNLGQTTYVSPITALEVATLMRKGRFKSPLSPQRWFEEVMRQPRFALAPMPPEVLIESQLLPGGIHKDPADRILAATARKYDYILLTADRALLDYARDGHLSALEC